MHMAKLCFVNVKMHAKTRIKNKENVIWEGERRICWEHYATSSKPLNVRTVVTKATQSIYTQTTASLIHRKNNFQDKKQPKKIDKC